MGVKVTRDHLEHYGILGMKWGVKNGPPYPLDEAHMSRAERRKNASQRAKEMTSVELEDAIERMRKEKQYIELKSERIGDGRDFVENLLLVVGATAVTSFATSVAKDGGKAGAIAFVKKVADSEVFRALYKKK